MKKFYKKYWIILCFVFLTSLFTFHPRVMAKTDNTIEKITMDVFIDTNGTASVTEIWNVNLSSGTEGYKPYGNLGESEITDFTVKDDTGKVYTTLSNWNTSASFDHKAYKCGITKTSGKTELCWGISSYGKRTYTLQYKITNLIDQYEDSQGIYFSFIPKEMKQSPRSVKITISSPNGFNKQNSQIWAFGYPNGTIHFSNNKIIMNSDGVLPTSHYMVALVKIPNGTFHTNNTFSKTFNEVYEESLGTFNYDLNDYPKNSIADISLSSVLLIPFGIIALPIVLSIIGMKLSKKTTPAKFPVEIDIGTDLKSLPSIKQVDYFRDIPCQKDLYYAYWIICQCDLESKKTYRSGLLGAILLNWIKNGYVEIKQTKKGLLNFKDNNYAIDLTKIETTNNEVEDKLLMMLKKASGSNGILEAKEFQKWSKKNYCTINNWFREVIDYETERLTNLGILTDHSKQVRDRKSVV